MRQNAAGQICLCRLEKLPFGKAQGIARRKRPNTFLRQNAAGQICLCRLKELPVRKAKKQKGLNWNPSDCFRTRAPGGMMHRAPFIKPARPCLSTRSQPAAFALRARSLASSSELRSLSILEKTDGCTNYRTDPVQV